MESVLSVQMGRIQYQGQEAKIDDTSAQPVKPVTIHSRFLSVKTTRGSFFLNFDNHKCVHLMILKQFRNQTPSRYSAEDVVVESSETQQLMFARIAMMVIFRILIIIRWKMAPKYSTVWRVQQDTTLQK